MAIARTIAPTWNGMTDFWASTGAVWRDMLLAEALVDDSISRSAMTKQL